MLAVATMDPTVQMLFFGLAVVLFVLAALNVGSPHYSLVAAGLASFTIPFFWNAIAAV